MQIIEDLTDEVINCGRIWHLFSVICFVISHLISVICPLSSVLCFRDRSEITI